MIISETHPKNTSLFSTLSKWWSDWTERKRALKEVSELKCCAEEEIERIASDLCVTPAEIQKLVSRGPDAANLLFRRMMALDIDRQEVARNEPQVFHDLKKGCALCESRRQCLKDMARDSTDPAWQDYCPNAETLIALKALPWMLRRRV